MTVEGRYRTKSERRRDDLTVEMTTTTDIVAPCIERMGFDSDAFSMPFYRVKQLDRRQLADEVEKLKAAPGPLVVDAKVAAEDIQSAQLLMLLGFRKVCTQFTLIHRLLETRPATNVRIARELVLDDAIIWEHAGNFRYDRFSLDPLLPSDGRRRLFFKWIKNSLSERTKLIAHLGQEFCSFSEVGEGVLIDLLSVLCARRGTGATLMDAVTSYAKSNGYKHVTVTTECENKPAWKLYLQRGFEVSGFVSVFHFGKKGGC